VGYTGPCTIISRDKSSWLYADLPLMQDGPSHPTKRDYPLANAT
jgi:hypothetical protein